MSRNHKEQGWTGRRVTNARKQIAATLPAPCVECGKPVTPDDLWDVGHITALALGGQASIYGAAHRTCNRKAGGKLGARYSARKKKQTREW